MTEPAEWSTRGRRSRALRFLEEVRLFRGLPREMLEAAAHELEEVRLPKGRIVYAQGGRMDQALYTILSGRVRVLSGHGEDERILGYLGSGDVFGAMELLTGGPALMTVETVLDTRTMALPWRAFHELLAKFPAAALPLARLLGRRLRTFSSLEGRRRTTVFMGVCAPEVGPEGTLTLLGLAKALVDVTGSTALLLDFAYGGPRPSGGGPGIVRALGELLDARGWFVPSLLADRAVHADDALRFLQFHLPEGDLDAVPPEVLPALLGEAKALASYVLVGIPPDGSAGARKLLEQVERVLVPLRPGQLVAHGVAERVAGLPPDAVVAGLIPEPGAEIPSAEEFRALTGWPRSFVLPLRKESLRSIQRVNAYPREALEDDEEGMVRARALARTLTRRRVGLCLGSGTALGWAHIGVLEVLIREGIPIDCVAGSSMGSIVAGMLAAGWSVERMKELAAEVTAEFLSDLTDYNWPIMRDGLIRGELLWDFLRKRFAGLRVEDLPKPLVIQATDLARGEPYLFREGDLADAIRASISLPGIFKMVPYQGRWLVDGGVHATLPTGPLRDLGADLVIAVNTTQDPRLTAEEVGDVGEYNLFDVFLRSLEVMQTRRTGFEADDADLVLQPQIRGVTWRELDRSADVMPFGVEEAEARLDDILKLLRKPPR